MEEIKEIKEELKGIKLVLTRMMEVMSLRYERKVGKGGTKRAWGCRR